MAVKKPADTELGLFGRVNNATLRGFIWNLTHSWLISWSDTKRGQIWFLKHIQWKLVIWIYQFILPIYDIEQPYFYYSSSHLYEPGNVHWESCYQSFITCGSSCMGSVGGKRFLTVWEQFKWNQVNQKNFLSCSVVFTSIGIFRSENMYRIHSWLDVFYVLIICKHHAYIVFFLHEFRHIHMHNM